jgi:hypothetical protein
MLNSFAIQVCGGAEMITQDEYDRLLKLFGMLSSSNDGEVLNAIAAISRILNVHGLAWSDILLPRKLMPTRVDPSDALDTGEDANAPKPLGAASLEDMLTALMTSPNVSSDTRRDLRDYARALKAGRLTPTIRADIQAMYNYAILSGRHV